MYSIRSAHTEAHIRKNICIKGAQAHAHQWTSNRTGFTLVRRAKAKRAAKKGQYGAAESSAVKATTKSKALPVTQAEAK